jgi:hypothetical protein
MTTERELLVRDVVRKSNILQHRQSKHAILNYLLTNEIIDTGDEVYIDIMKMDENGILKVQY